MAAKKKSNTFLIIAIIAIVLIAAILYFRGETGPGRALQPAYSDLPSGYIPPGYTPSYPSTPTYTVPQLPTYTAPQPTYTTPEYPSAPTYTAPTGVTPTKTSEQYAIRSDLYNELKGEFDQFGAFFAEIEPFLLFAGEDFGSGCRCFCEDPSVDESDKENKYKSGCSKMDPCTYAECLSSCRNWCTANFARGASVRAATCDSSC